MLWPDKITREGYLRVQLGMSQPEVETILGSPNLSHKEYENAILGDGFDFGLSLTQSQNWLPGDKQDLHWSSGSGIMDVRIVGGHVIYKVWAPRSTWFQRLQMRLRMLL
jgi:hypothetical protein